MKKLGKYSLGSLRLLSTKDIMKIFRYDTLLLDCGFLTTQSLFLGKMVYLKRREAYGALETVIDTLAMSRTNDVLICDQWARASLSYCKRSAQKSFYLG